MIITGNAVPVELSVETEVDELLLPRLAQQPPPLMPLGVLRVHLLPDGSPVQYQPEWVEPNGRARCLHGYLLSTLCVLTVTLIMNSTMLIERWKQREWQV